MPRVRLLLALLLIASPASAQNATREPLLPAVFEDELGRLPPNMQDGAGLFLASLIAWTLLGMVLVLVLVPLVKALAARTKSELDSKLIAILAPPAFLLAVAFGLVDSLRVFALQNRVLAIVEGAWTVVFIVALTYVVYKVWSEIILDVGRRVSRRAKTSEKLYPVISKMGGVVIVLAGIWFVVASFGVNMTLFTTGGVMGGLIIAFAAQDTLANFFAGIHILLDQPFREGDRIEIKEEDTWGDVVAIGMRTTRILTRDNRLVIVPNNVIGTNSVINHSFPSMEYRRTAKVGVAYGTDLEQAREVLVGAVRGVPGVERSRIVQALFVGFGDSSLDFDVRYWIANFQDTPIIDDRVNTAIYNALQHAGIEIPFPQRVLWNGARSEAAVVGA